MAEVGIMPADVPLMPRGVRLHFDKVRDLWVLLAPERTINLDPVGLAILREIDGETPLSDIAGGLAQKYEAPEAQVLADSSEFIAGLMERRILEVRP